MMRYTRSIFILLLTCVRTYDAQNLSDVKSLYTDLFAGYRKEVMPMLDQTKPLDVGIIFYIASFNSFREVDETISVTAGVGLNWTDPSLVWDPASYGNLSSTIIESKDLWLPPVYLINRVDSMEPIGDGAKIHVAIKASGEVVYIPGGIMDAKCPSDISKFPFDTQICSFRISPWNIPPTYMKFSSLYDKIQLQYFSPHSDWTLEGHSTYVDSTGSGFFVKLTIKRHPLYNVVMIILPTLLFALLNPLVFVLPVDSGERVSLAMTILLSYAIFLTLVSASIPTSSNSMCVLLISMIVIISISGLIVVGSIISVRFYYLDEKKKISTLLKTLVSMILRNSNDIVPMDDNKDPVVNGKDASRLLDFMFLYGTYLAIILVIVGYFLYVLI